MKTPTLQFLLEVAAGLCLVVWTAWGTCVGDEEVAGEWIFEPVGEWPGWALNTGGDGAMGNLGLTGGAEFSTNVPPVNCDCGHSLFLPGANGVAGAVSIYNYDPLAGEEKFSILAWVRRDSAEGVNLSARIFSDVDSTALTNTTSGVEFRFSGNAGNLALRINGTEVSSTVGGIAPTNGEWHHVAVVYDGTRPATSYATRNVHFYVDGIQRGVGSVLQGVVVATNYAPVVVGNTSPSRTAANLLAGNIDDVLVVPGWAPDAVGNGNANAAIQCFMNSADDISSPFIVAPPDVEAEAGECLEPVAVALGNASAWDDCGVMLVTNDAPAVFDVGLTEVTWCAVDVGGNVTSDTQRVTVLPSSSRDCDGDGWSDWEEWEAGTDPTDAASAPSLAKGVLIHAVRYNAVPSNQYVQLHNSGRFAVRLDGFALEVAGAAYETKAVFPADTVLRPGHFLLVGGGGVTNADFTASLGLPMSYASVPTAGVRLVGPAGTTNGPVDVLMYGAHEPFNEQGLPSDGWNSTATDLWAGPGWQLVRRSLGGDADSRNDWTFSAAPESPWHASDVPDTDDDGLPDETEFAAGWDACSPDTDGDGLEDDFEQAHGLNPASPDSDGDGVADGAEIDPATGRPFAETQLGDGVTVVVVPPFEGWAMGDSIGADGTVAFRVTASGGVGVEGKISEGGPVREAFSVEVDGTWQTTMRLTETEVDVCNGHITIAPAPDGGTRTYVVRVSDASNGAVTNPPYEGPDISARFWAISPYTVTNGVATNEVLFSLLGVDGARSVAPGESATYVVVPEPPAGVEIVWGLEDIVSARDDEPVRVDFADGVLQVDGDSGRGWVTIRAEAPNGSSALLTVAVGCGCASCDGEPGSGTPELGSVRLALGLGRTAGGYSAGELWLEADELPEAGLSASALRLSTASGEVRVRRVDGAIDRVEAPQCVATVCPAAAGGFGVLFERAASAGGGTVAEWRFATAPDGAGGVALDISKAVGGQTNQWTYSRNAATGAWSLTECGLREETRVSARNGALRTETRTLAAPGGTAVSAERLTWQTFAFGEALVEKVADPDGAALRTTYAWQTDPAVPGYGLRSAEFRPDGGWTRWQYDAAGRVTNEISPWLSSETDLREVRTSYAAVAPDDANLPEDTHKPRRVEEVVAGIPVSLAYYAYPANALGGRTVVEERAAAPDAPYGAPDNLRTVRDYYPRAAGAASSRELWREFLPDGRLTTWTYDWGAYDPAPAPGVFVPGSGAWRRVRATHGTSTAPDGLAWLTTRETEIRDPFDRVAAAWTEVFDGTNYLPAAWTTCERDEWGRETLRAASNGDVVQQVWDCCGLVSRTDADGLETIYVRDALRRVVARVENGVTHATVYDAADRAIAETTSADGLSLATSSAYDLAGRLLSTTDAAGLTTARAYADGGRTVTTTLPGGATRVETRHLDGQTAAVTGTAQVPVFHEYGVSTNGVRWTRTRTAAADSPAWRLDETDFLGRPFRSSAPAFGGGTRTETRLYDAAGRHIAVETLAGTNLLRTLHAHDALSRPFRTALDADGDGAIGLASPDRVTDAIERFESDGTDLWQVRETLAYPWENSAAPFTNSVRRVRLTGLGTTGPLGVLAAETVDIDPHGVATTSRTWRARSAQTRVETAASPRSSVTAADTYVAGHLQTSLSSSGVLVTNAYDALGRRTLTRIGDDAHASGVLLAYDAAGRPAWQEDLAGNRTAYGYDSETGLRTTVTDALSNVVHTAYDLQGRVTNTWGATYPVGYEYDAYGRMAAMQTWRDENGAPDVTHWNYDPATGLLTNKVYADGLGPRYEYDPAGRLAKRTWARGVETDYSYDALGQLVAIDYSDSTPDVAFTYDRLGRQLTVTDILGTRTNVYDALNLLEERHPDGTTLVRSYDLYGRPSGISLGPDYAVGYGYDSFSRFSTVSVSNGPTFTYSYVPNSSLLSGYTNDLGLAVAYEYEPHRDVKTIVSNAWGTNTISTFAYDYDAIGRRTRRIDDGTTTNLFGYNLRSELVSAEMGTNTYSYAYDPIGNRTSASENGTTTTYAANSLNQYTALNPASTNPTPFTYDPDGNMTSDGTWSYTWDAENRLIEVQPLVTNLDSTLVQYMYDAQSRRIARREFAWMAFLHDDPAWRYVQGRAYRYDDWNLLQELKPATTPRTPPTYIPQTDLSLTGVTGLVAAAYVWGLDLSGTLHDAGGVGGLLMQRHSDANSPWFSFCDANGNITDLLDEDGALSAHYDYDADGNTCAQSGDSANDNSVRFSTKFFDDVTSLYYFGYRFFCLEMKRWCNRDPLEERGGLNLYVASNNNPISLNDLFGLVTYDYVDGDYEDVLEAISHLTNTAQNTYGFFSEEQIGVDEKVTVKDDPNCKICTHMKIYTCTVTLRFRNTSKEGSISIYKWKSPLEDAEAQKLFDAVYEQIMAHEQGHLEIWRKYANKLTRSFSATESRCSEPFACLKAEQAAQQKYLEFLKLHMNEFSKAQAFYCDKDCEERDKIVQELIDEYDNKELRHSAP